MARRGASRVSPAAVGASAQRGCTAGGPAAPSRGSTGDEDMVRGRRSDEDAPGRPRRSLYYYLNVLGMGDGACRRRAVVVTAWTRSRSRSRDPVPASVGALQDGRPPRRAPAMSTYSLTHLRQLEAESIHIIREVAAEFEKPVMLYSIGKDSAVMLRLAQKAFHPGRLPFPLLHVDTTWKFREMIEFRDAFCRRARARPDRPHQPEGRTRRRINPFDHGSKKYTDVMKTQALKQALTAGGFDAAFGGARRDEEKSRAKERVYSLPRPAPPVGPEEPAAGAVEPLQRQGQQGREHPRLPAVATGPSSTSGSTSTSRTSRSCRSTSPSVRPGRRARRHADHGRRRAACRCGPARSRSMKLVRFRTLGCYPLTGAIESRRRRRCPRSSRRCCSRRPPSGRAG